MPSSTSCGACPPTRTLSSKRSKRASASAPGVPTLKVGYNRVHGYYIELSKAQSERAPPDYVRRQTLKGAERYVTPELKRFEDPRAGCA